jgi:hypothetical protein
VRERSLLGGSLAALVFAACALALGSGLTRGTFASFVGETQSAGSTFAGGWIGAPSTPTATASGADVAFAWTPGTHGPVTGQQLAGVDNGTNADCTGAAYASLATMASASTATYTDPSRATASNNGNWFCYQIVSTSSTVWTAATPAPALQIGLVATGVATANTSSRCLGSPVPAAGVIDCNDTITLTFNQRPNLATSGTIKVCSWASNGTIVVGDSAAGNCTASNDAFTIGVLQATSIGANRTYTSSTYTLTTTAPYTLTVTLKPFNLSPPTVAGPLTFVPASSIQSFVTTHPVAICTAASSTCRPSTSSAF